MRKLFTIFFSIFALFFIFSFISSNNVYAQACTGDSGAPGTCTAPMACTPANIDGQGSCTDPLKICCLSGLPAGDGGSGDCSDVCSSSADCLDSPVNLQCPNGVCSDINACPSCIGNSWWVGACLPYSVCNGKGKNANDGAAGCSAVDVCCTNAPSSNTCTLTASPPFLVGAYFWLELNTSTPNTFYTLTSSPACSGTTNITTDSTGKASFTKSCGPPQGTYTITASSGPTTCNVSVGVLNEPGPSCTGKDTGRSGWCVVLVCPQNTFADGGYPDQCSANSEQRCCVPILSKTAPIKIFCNSAGQPSDDLSSGKIYTAIGCIPVENFQVFAEFLLGWGMGIAGGIAILLIIYAGFLIITSGGNPQKLQAGKELLTAAVMGLLLLIFGAWVLRLIGIQILNIPGLVR